MSATDDVDGVVQVAFDASDVNLEVAGTYDVIYTATDLKGNVAEVVVQITVTDGEDTTKPVITGAVDINYTIGDAEPSYLDGVSATDDVDGEVDVTVDTTNVNLAVKGVYNITYTAIDNAGNKEEVTVRVIVTSDEVPVVGETVTFKYTGTATGNMTTGNNAVSVGLVESVFNVTTDSVGSYNNIIGLNKDGSVKIICRQNNW